MDKNFGFPHCEQGDLLGGDEHSGAEDPWVLRRHPPGRRPPVRAVAQGHVVREAGDVGGGDRLDGGGGDDDDRVDEDGKEE